jgi:hypothetical protein
MMTSRPKLQVVQVPPANGVRSEDSTAGVVLQGNLAVIAVFDVIQWVCENRQSWNIRLLEQAVDASITVVEGEIVDAKWGALFGTEALIEIAECKQGSFELAPVRSESLRSLRGNWRQILLNAAQRLDERNGTSQGHPSRMPDPSPKRSKSSGQSGEHQLTGIQSGQPAAPSAIDQQAAAELIDSGFAAMREGDLDRARQLWNQALTHDPGNRALQFNLRKLDEKKDSFEPI